MWVYEVDGDDGTRIRVSASEPVDVEVCDGRIGRDPSKIGADGYGEVLLKIVRPSPMAIGDRLTLPGGAVVEVIGESFNMWRRADGVMDGLQRVAVGDVWESAEPRGAEPPTGPGED